MLGVELANEIERHDALDLELDEVAKEVREQSGEFRGDDAVIELWGFTSSSVAPTLSASSPDDEK